MGTAGAAVRGEHTRAMMRQGRTGRGEKGEGRDRARRAMIIKYRGDDRPKGSKTNDRCRAAPPQGTREPLLPDGVGPKRQRTRERGRARAWPTTLAKVVCAAFSPRCRLPGLLASRDAAAAGEADGGGLLVWPARWRPRGRFSR
ncbi:hypothetical protein MTO96_011021 [Rhipicephalus appendiculatus]